LHFIDAHPAQSDKYAHTLPTGIDADGCSLKEAVEAYEKQLIANVLEQNGGNTEQTAKILNIPLRTLYGKIKKYRLK
jgi:transcriptional regulator with PAS, ATPase and Fis domain